MSGEAGVRGRRAVLIALPALVPLVVAGCGALGSNPEPRQWHRLEDPASPGRAEGAGIARVLLVEVVATSALHEGTALVFSRAPGTLEHYRFASWSEPPGRRLGQLVERRLEARGRFSAVGASTSGLRGDLLLRVGLEELVHDAAVEPG
ncbi:MAG TPA: ABC-type transport auxiliary lipoprotein family protein, partial [Quisquiliibacterium sp.]|nr:ABC-type transport auxiliary lipoprotein family protein [Quisquiliibacterium sp.]